MKPRHLLGFSCFLVFRDVVISRFTVPHVKLLPVCARRGLFSAEAVVAVQAEDRTMKVINRRGSYQQPSAPSQKKAEGKKRKSP